MKNILPPQDDKKPPYMIIYDCDRSWVCANGFYSLKKTAIWINNFNPDNYVDKTLKKENLIVICEKEKVTKGMKGISLSDVIITEDDIFRYHNPIYRAKS